MKVAADIVQHGRDFLFRKLPDQPKQLITLHTHEPIVRIAGVRRGDQQRARCVPGRDRGPLILVS
jgi:hypothetical protein